LKVFFFQHYLSLHEQSAWRKAFSACETQGRL
jgi:hypothetical protein